MADQQLNGQRSVTLNLGHFSAALSLRATRARCSCPHDAGAPHINKPNHTLVLRMCDVGVALRVRGQLL